MSAHAYQPGRLTPCVCLDIFFKGWDILGAIDAVADAGVPAIEFWGGRDKDLQAIAERARRYRLTIAAMSLDPAVRLLEGDSVREFLGSVEQSLAAGKQIGCQRLVVHVQEVRMGSGSQWSRDPRRIPILRTQRRNIAAALREAAPMAAASGVLLMIEPLNDLVDHQGYCLSTTSDGVDVLRQVGSTSVKMLFDIYHMQISEGNLIGNLTATPDLWGHLHIADVPGRHEPGTGEINFANVLRSARRAGYAGYVGMELIPTADPVSAMRNTARIIQQANLD
jgi:hydroxypyruvate isomerase